MIRNPKQNDQPGTITCNEGDAGKTDKQDKKKQRRKERMKKRCGTRCSKIHLRQRSSNTLSMGLTPSEIAVFPKTRHVIKSNMGVDPQLPVSNII